MAIKVDREVGQTSGHMTNKKQYVFISTRPVATKLDRIVVQLKEPQTRLLRGQMLLNLK